MVKQIPNNEKLERDGLLSQLSLILLINENRPTDLYVYDSRVKPFKFSNTTFPVQLDKKCCSYQIIIKIYQKKISPTKILHHIAHKSYQEFHLIELQCEK